ncbi:MAG: hypothetical protein U0703_25935 [Anaerolineae bacterium]
MRGTNKPRSPFAFMTKAMGRSVGMKAKPVIVDDIVAVEQHDAAAPGSKHIFEQPLGSAGDALLR